MYNKTKLSPGMTSLFVGIYFEHQFEDGGPKIKGTGQVIVTKNKEDKWDYEEMEVLNIDEIYMMGVSITGTKEQQAAFDHFRSMGISLYREAGNVLREIIDCSGTVEQFVFEQTGITLPK